jgi:hypothetical protein
VVVGAIVTDTLEDEQATRPHIKIQPNMRCRVLIFVFLANGLRENHPSN